MQLTITVVQRSEVLTGINKNGKPYNKIDVIYKKDGKVEAKTFAEFANQAIWEDLQKLNPDDVKLVTIGKDDNGFWQWFKFDEVPTDAGVQPQPTQDGMVDSTPKPQAKGTGKVLGSNYETSEERARRQVLIVRQSSISNAAAFVAATNPKGLPLDPEGLLVIAKIFEAYVLGE